MLRVSGEGEINLWCNWHRKLSRGSEVHAVKWEKSAKWTCQGGGEVGREAGWGGDGFLVEEPLQFPQWGQIQAETSPLSSALSSLEMWIYPVCVRYVLRSLYLQCLEKSLASGRPSVSIWGRKKERRKGEGIWTWIWSSSPSRQTVALTESMEMWARWCLLYLA